MFLLHKKRAVFIDELVEVITTSPTVVLVVEPSDDLLSNFSLKDYVFCSMLVKQPAHESINGTASIV